MSSSAKDVAGLKNRTSIVQTNDLTSSSSSSSSSSPRNDVGLRSSMYYEQRLPGWQYYLRQKLHPLIRLETPYLAWIQGKMRSSVLDSYFSMTANLGTHTFFMIVLPMLFWCGHTSLGRGMVHILALGVFSTSILKDMFSLPRPASPPLNRITMSGSASLEYGFPSTHSANAVSVAVLILLKLRSPSSQLQSSTRLLIEVLTYFYAFSIVIGRIYCGMHGFIDVIVGSLIGAALSVIECAYGATYDRFLLESTWISPAIIALIIITLVKVHPKPAENCPCFDDTIAFSGVMIGVEAGVWRYANGSWASNDPVPATVPFNLNQMGWSVAILRILTGIMVIFAWREVMKPISLKLLSYLFDVIEKYCLAISSTCFKLAFQIKSIYFRVMIENVFPFIFNLLRLRKVYHMGKGRSDPAPQSAPSFRIECRGNSESSCDYGSTSRDENDFPVQASGALTSLCHKNKYSPCLPASENETLIRKRLLENKKRQKEKKEASLEPQPSHIRYIVEVITKLLVYTGIGWLSVETIPILFELIGLGLIK
ncbi:hypothetical protein K3495_g5690 [Podosphaera aphanis]|nr:hypothetical protein K3495_g5690 [Podosphaera aphanis]